MSVDELRLEELAAGIHTTICGCDKYARTDLPERLHDWHKAHRARYADIARRLPALVPWLRERAGATR